MMLNIAVTYQFGGFHTTLPAVPRVGEYLFYCGETFEVRRVSYESGTFNVAIEAIRL